MLQSRGPLLIAANHPNSFLDAIILATLFKRPIYSLARGDAFANKFYTKLLRSLNMLPVYRLSEGAENLENNYSTFSSCIEIFKRNGIVLMFSEGRCINEWHLRPLKKGTARLALSAWQQHIPLQVLPLGINYSSFRIFGKNIILNFGDIITKNDIIQGSEGKEIATFNANLWMQLKNLVIEIDNNDKQKIKQAFSIHQSTSKKTLLFIPAIVGYLIHAPLYFTVSLLIKNRANDHYDSIVVGLLFILYPIYLLTITIIVYYFIMGSVWALLLLMVIPFTAWSFLQLKRQIK